MAGKRRSYAFALFMLALCLVLALGVCLLVLGLTSPTFGVGMSFTL